MSSAREVQKLGRRRKTTDNDESGIVKGPVVNNSLYKYHQISLSLLFFINWKKQKQIDLGTIPRDLFVDNKLV